MDGLHIRSVLQRHSEDPSITAMQIMVWPLPDDNELHQALYRIARDAIHAELNRRKMVTGDVTDISAVGPMQ